MRTINRTGYHMQQKATEGVIYAAAASLGVAEIAKWTIQDWAAVTVAVIAALSFGLRIFQVLREFRELRKVKKAAIAALKADQTTADTE